MCGPKCVKDAHTSLEAAFSQASMLSANVSVSSRTLCLHDERNARNNCEVKTWRLVCEQPLTSIFPCVDSIHLILSALNSAHNSPPECVSFGRSLCRYSPFHAVKKWRCMFKRS